MSKTQYNIEPLPVERAELAEGPHWDPITQQLYFVHLSGKEVHRYDPSTKQEFKAKIDCEGQTTVNMIIPIESKPNQYIISLGKTLQAIEWDGISPSVTSMKQLAIAEHGDWFNDAKCDVKGRLWIGTCGNDWENFDKPEIPGLGVLYRLDSSKQLTHFTDGIKVSNGLAWSPDSKYFYHVDTATYRVDVYDYDLEAGTVSNRRPLFDFKVNNVAGVPDGMCIDSNGNLWVATFNGNSILNIDGNTGTLISTVEFPVPVSSCTFGGSNLDILYVTTTQIAGLKGEQSDHSDAGATFQVIGLGVKGASAGVPYKCTVL